jgi:hypothetical protein
LLIYIYLLRSSIFISFGSLQDGESMQEAEGGEDSGDEGGGGGGGGGVAVVSAAAAAAAERAVEAAVYVEDSGSGGGGGAGSGAADGEEKEGGGLSLRRCTGRCDASARLTSPPGSCVTTTICSLHSDLRLALSCVSSTRSPLSFSSLIV